MRIFQFAFLFSLLYSQYHSSEWSSITSLLTPTGIEVTDDGIVYASTAGGLLEFNPGTEEFKFIKTEEDLVYLDLATISIDIQDRLWLGGAYPRGCLQVYDPEIGLVKYFEDDLIVSIDKIQIGKDIAFSVYQGTTSSDIGILKFILDEDGLPEYQDYYNNFTDEPITEIRDLDIFQDSLLYVTTDQGIFAGNHSDNLKLSTEWDVIYTGNNALQFLPEETGFIITDSLIINYSSGDEYYDFSSDLPHHCEKKYDNENVECTDDLFCYEYPDPTDEEPGNTVNLGYCGPKIIQAKWDGFIILLFDRWYYEINNGDPIYIPVGNQNLTETIIGEKMKTIFTSFIMGNNNEVFLGVQGYGILITDKQLENYSVYTPDTPLTNSFQAITITRDGNMAATSHLGTLYYNGINNQNYIANKFYNYYPGSSNTFQALSLAYDPGDHIPISIAEKDNGKLIYCNSGSLPGYGTLIELDHTTNLITKYDNTDEIIDGWDGIYIPGINSHYMLVNQIEKDNLGNIWVTNPFCEKYGHLLAIQLAAYENSWVHVGIPDSSSFRPQTIALEQSGSLQRAWIGFAYDSQDHILYSSGGIKVLQYSEHTINNMTDTSWVPITNPEMLRRDGKDISIWSLAVDHMDFLWVLSEKGVQGYEVRGNNEITLDPLSEDGEGLPYDFLTQYSFIKGSRIRVDSQNNKWIITHQGVWVIQESMAYWPSEEGLHPYNSWLLSDIVYDVAFDNDKGLAYLSTDKGISILQIPFADNPIQVESMYISPNPFIVPDDEFVMIKNIPSGATIQIMTITGVLIRNIRLEPKNSQYLWDGRNDRGEVVGTAVYLVAAHHPTEPNMVSKVALIRK